MYANLLQANVDTSNGVVHVIDTVLIPNQAALEARDIPTTAEGVSALSTLVTAVTAAGLGSVLSGKTLLTVFCPTNEAFARLPADFLAYLLGNKAALTDVLTYHVVGGNVSSFQLTDGEIVPTVEGKNLTIHKDPRGGIFVDYAQVIAANNEASNGVAHIIDAVMLPGNYHA